MLTDSFAHPVTLHESIVALTMSDGAGMQACMTVVVDTVTVSSGVHLSTHSICQCPFFDFWQSFHDVLLRNSWHV